MLRGKKMTDLTLSALNTNTCTTVI